MQSLFLCLGLTITSARCIERFGLDADKATDIGNILPDSTAAPALQGHQRELERHMRADSLEKGLQGRPKPEDLVKKGILEGKNPTFLESCHWVA
jgi:hypothetical protein